MARIAHSATVATNSLFPYGERNAKILVFGGTREIKGTNNELWEYDIDTKTWVQLFDGYDWTQTEDTHLHAKKVVYENLKGNIQKLKSSHEYSSIDTAFEENPHPKPRMGHTATMVYHKSTSTIKKDIPIRWSCWAERVTPP